MSAELKLELSAKIVLCNSGHVEMFSHGQTGYGVNPWTRECRAHVSSQSLPVSFLVWNSCGMLPAVHFTYHPKIPAKLSKNMLCQSSNVKDIRACTRLVSSHLWNLDETPWDMKGIMGRKKSREGDTLPPPYLPFSMANSFSEMLLLMADFSLTCISFLYLNQLLWICI